MIKFYIPDGHLEKKTLELFEKAGFEVSISDRDYNPKIDDPDILLKRIRPQDFPFVLGTGKGDVAITGSDILKEFRLQYPKMADNVKELLDLQFGKTKLCVAVSEDVFPDVKTIEDCAKKFRGKEAVVATEYPGITAEYLKKKGIKAIIRQPAGKTEAWLTPPVPEADMIVETTETGRTLKENRCAVLDTVFEATAHLIAKRSREQRERKKNRRNSHAIRRRHEEQRQSQRVYECSKRGKPERGSGRDKQLRRKAHGNRPERRRTRHIHRN